MKNTTAHQTLVTMLADAALNVPAPRRAVLCAADLVRERDWRTSMAVAPVSAATLAGAHATDHAATAHAAGAAAIAIAAPARAQQRFPVFHRMSPPM